MKSGAQKKKISLKKKSSEKFAQLKLIPYIYMLVYDSNILHILRFLPDWHQQGS